MYNFTPFNGVPTFQIPDTTGTHLVKYGDFILHNGSDIRINNLEYLKWKATEIQQESFGNDGEIFNKRETLQVIKVTGSFKKASRGALLAFIDTFKSNITKDNLYLEVTEGEWSRRVRCTCTNHEFNEQNYNIDWMQFVLEFSTYKYWEESAAQEILIEAVNTSPYQFWIARDGTAEARLTAIVAFTSATGVNQVTFSLGTQSITINGSIATNDNITIDGENQRVLKNGNPIGFIGEIPKLKNPTNQFTLTANGTFTYNITTQYRKTYK